MVPRSSAPVEQGVVHLVTNGHALVFMVCALYAQSTGEATVCLAHLTLLARMSCILASGGMGGLLRKQDWRVQQLFVEKAGGDADCTRIT